MPSNHSKYLLWAVNAVAASSLLVGLFGCADAFTYANDARAEGLALYNQGDYADAEASFANAARQDPRDYKSYYYMGSSYDQLQAYQQAIGSYRTCLSVMSLTLLGKNDTPFRYRALDALATAISHSSTHGLETVALEQKCAGKALVEDQWLLAKIYRYTGDADAAVDAYNKAVLIANDNFTLTKEAGLYEETLGQKQHAIYALRHAYAVDPQDQQVSDALHRLGVSPDVSAIDNHGLAQPAAYRGSTVEWEVAPAAPTPTAQTPQN